jgi:hypothetical protein
MEVGLSWHRRDSSLSSFGSLPSASSGDDFSVVHLPASPGSPSKSVQCRRRLGAEMSILAATSPEIKALNLPITPSFPQELTARHHRSNSNASASSCSNSSISSCSRPMGSLTPLLASMDDVDGPPGLPERFMQAAIHIFVDETDNLIQTFQNHNLDANGDYIQQYGDAAEDKENIHPNLIHIKVVPPTRKKAFGKRHVTTQQRPPKPFQRPTSLKRCSLHRRASYDSLPSPEQIGPSPSALLKSMSENFTFSSIDVDADEIRRTSLLVSSRAPKSLNLTTGFR